MSMDLISLRPRVETVGRSFTRAAALGLAVAVGSAGFGVGCERPAPRVEQQPTIIAPGLTPHVVPHHAGDVEELAGRHLSIPVEGASKGLLLQSFDQLRGARPHEAIDILAPRGTRVLAVEAGTIAKLFTSKPGGLTIYQFDPTGRYAYYYAHLNQYADGLAEGQAVQQGQVVGYVGSTGNADPRAPHLHFAIFKLGPDRHWWQGEAIDPYAVFTRYDTR